MRAHLLVPLALVAATPARADTARTLPAGTWKADIRYIGVNGGPIRLRRSLVVPGELLGSLGLTPAAARPDDLPLGQLDLELSFAAQLLAPGLAYGVSDWLSIGFAVPVFLDASVHVRRFDYSGDWGYNPEFPADRSRSLLLPAFDSRAVTGAAGLQRALVEAFEYEPIEDVHSSGLGDMVLAARARLWNRSRTVAAVQPELLLPTGATEDPDNLIDIGLGDGHVDLGARFLVDIALARSTLLGLASSASHSFPHLMTTRVYQDPSFPLASRAPWPAPYTFVGFERTVLRDPGDVFTVGAGLTQGLGSAWQVTVRGEYLTAGSDHFTDGDERLPALEVDTARTVATAGGGLRFTLVDSFLRGRAPLPLELDLDVARSFSPTPEAAMTTVTATASIYLAHRPPPRR